MSTNFLFLCSDEHQRAIAGCYGNALVQTPNIDKLAASGRLFTNAYCNAPLCVPARAAMATGRYAHSVHSWCNTTGYSGQWAHSWGHRLAEQGHRVTTIGKLHYHSDSAPTGFDDQRIPMNLPEGRGDLRGLLRGQMPVSKGYSKHIKEAGSESSPYIRYDEGITEHAQSWLAHESKGHDRPWALFVSWLSPHYPLAVPRRFSDLYPVEAMPLPLNHRPEEWTQHPALALYRRLRDLEEVYDEATLRRAISTYYGMVTFVDEQIGKVMYALELSGHLANTTVLYTSDHGEHLGNHGLWWKRGFYDTAAAVPLIMSGPGITPGVCPTPVSHVDIYPTILETVGATPASPDRDLPGRALTSIGPAEERVVFSEYHGGGSAAGSYMIRSRDFKYIYYCDAPAQLFNMKTDPEEVQDLGTDPDHASVRERLHAELVAICDPDEIDRQAKSDQQRLIEQEGGMQAILQIPVGSYFPPPDVPRPQVPA